MFARSPKLHACGLQQISVFTGCSKLAASAPPSPDAIVANRISQEVTDWDESTGGQEATKSIEIRPRASGYLDAIAFKDGQLGKHGDALSTIDLRPYRAEANPTRVELQRSQAQLELAKLSLRRAQQLVQTKAIASEQFDRRQTELEEAPRPGVPPPLSFLEAKQAMQRNGTTVRPEPTWVRIR